MQPSADGAGVAVDEVAVRTVDHDVGCEADPGHDHRQPAGERLEHHERVRLVGAGQHEDVCRMEVRHRVGMRADEGDPVGHAVPLGDRRRLTDHLGAAADDQQRGTRRPGQRLDRERQALALELVADEDGNRQSVGQGEPGPGGGPLGVGRGAEALGVDAVGDHRDRRSHPAVRRDQQFGLARGERHHGAVRATSVADPVAQRGEQVDGIAHHAPDEVAAGLHRDLQQPVVHVDVAREHVVVADAQGARALGEEALGPRRADRAEPDDVAGPLEVGSDRRLGLPARRAAGGRRGEALDGRAERDELALEVERDAGDAAAA